MTLHLKSTFSDELESLGRSIGLKHFFVFQSYRHFGENSGGGAQWANKVNQVVITSLGDVRHTV